MRPSRYEVVPVRTSPRLFEEISNNWASCQFEFLELMLYYIAITSSPGSLLLTSQLNQATCETGVRITDEQMSALNITGGEQIPTSNYFVSPPRTEKSFLRSPRGRVGGVEVAKGWFLESAVTIA